MMERRTAQRFDMRLPVVVLARDDGPTELHSETRDVSSRGAYFTVNRDLPIGSSIELVLTLPREIIVAGPIRVRCQGRIVRVEEKENEERKVGVATVIDRYEFMRAEATTH